MTNEELDKWLAKKVMGWHIEGYYYWDSDHNRIMLVSDWHPSTSIEQAMMCLEKYCDDMQLEYMIQKQDDPIHNKKYVVSIGENVGWSNEPSISNDIKLAICEILRKAVGK